MPLGPQQGWIGIPSFEGSDQQNWATWITNAVQDLQGPNVAPLPPKVTTLSHPGAVQIIWNELNQATAYSVYETASAITPPGLPIATVAANMQAQSNSMMRFNLNDTVTRYYSVVTITQYGRSAVSTPVPGVALAVSSPVIPISNVGVNKNGVGGGVGGGGGIYSIKPGVTL